MTTIPQNAELLKNLVELLEKQSKVFKQKRSYERGLALLWAEIMLFARHTITQCLMGLGETQGDWSAWYRFFSQRRFNAERASASIFKETLTHVGVNEVYVVVGDGTQTPRTGKKIEGSGWLRNFRTPPFKVGIHLAQRWFNGCWLMPPEQGYSRAVPLQWLPAFTVKARRTIHPPVKEWEAAVQFLTWLQTQLRQAGRPHQRLLMLGDGTYETVALWQALPSGVILLTRSAKNRALFHLPTPHTGRGRRRQYGEAAASPQTIWQQRTGWQRLSLTVRGRERHLQYQVQGPVLRRRVPDRPLFLIVVRGKHSAHTRREPLPLLVNASADADGHWQLPLPVETLLFWAWQRWEIEVCQRELKSQFGLGDKQCWNPHAAILSVQWSAWVYALLLLAGYRTWGLCAAPPVPTAWWHGSRRWSFNTLMRALRAALWGEHEFTPLFPTITINLPENNAYRKALRNIIYASTPL
jgi:hypothetical protein